jgi:arsenite methyltransferase
VLRPGGRVLVLDTDWDSIVWRSGDDERMERVLAAWEEHLVDPHLPRSLKGSLERAGFEVAPRGSCRC